MRYAPLLLSTLVLSASAASAQCPAAWVSTPQGTSNTVDAVAALPNGSVVAGGLFTNPASRIASYDSSSGTWSALGSGANNSVHALASYGSTLYIGGLFSSIGGVTANRVAYYDNVGSFHPMDSGIGVGVNGDVVTLAPFGSAGQYVAAGGSFAQLGDGQTANNIAIWTGLAWSTAGSGTNGQVKSIAPLANNNELVVAGLFTTAGGVSNTSHIAIYNTLSSSWSALSTGTNGAVNAVAVLPDGTILAGGSFTQAGGVSVNNIAKYDRVANVWSAVGSGTNASVNALKLLPGGTDIVLSGNFTTAGGVTASHIARLVLSSNSYAALGAGVNGFVGALTLRGSDLFMGGTFGSAGGNTVSNFAEYFVGIAPPVITVQPAASRFACGTSDVGISIEATGTGTLTYRWTRNGQLITSAINPTAITPNLVIPPGPFQTGTYSAVVVSSCGNTASTSSVVISCRADFNCDGDLNPDDLGDFITVYFTTPTPPTEADFNMDGSINPDDLGDYITAYDMGCN